MQNIAIVGAGLLGRLLALLLQDKAQVTLFEKGGLNDANTTGRLAAAMVAPVAESVIASQSIVNMGQASRTLWPELLAAVGLPSDIYQQRGTVVVAHRQDQNDLSHFQQRLKQLSTNSKEQSVVRNVSNHDLHQLEPELSKQFTSGLFLEDEGDVDNHKLYDLSEALILSSSIQLELNASIDIEQLTSNYDQVVDCRGLGASGELANEQSQLRGVRGEVARVHAPEVNLTRPIRLMHPRYPIYIAPKPNNVYVIGATEIESQDDKNPTLRSTMELLSAAYSVHTGFAEGEVLSIQAGLRPTLLDNEPSIVVEQKGVRGKLIQANGLYRHGYLISPYILQQILLSLGVETFGSQPQIDESLITKIAS